METKWKVEEVMVVKAKTTTSNSGSLFHISTVSFGHWHHVPSCCARRARETQTRTLETRKSEDDLLPPFVVRVRVWLHNGAGEQKSQTRKQHLKVLAFHRPIEVQWIDLFLGILTRAQCQRS